MRIGFTELILIVLVCIVCIKPDKIKEYATTFGKVVKSVKDEKKKIEESMSDITNQVKSSMDDIEEVTKK